MTNKENTVSALILSGFMGLGALAKGALKELSHNSGRLTHSLESKSATISEHLPISPTRTYAQIPSTSIEPISRLLTRGGIRAGLKWTDFAGDAQRTIYVPPHQEPQQNQITASPRQSQATQVVAQTQPPKPTQPTPIVRKTTQLDYPLSYDLRPWDNPIQTQPDAFQGNAYAMVAAMENYLYRTSSIKYKLQEQSLYSIAHSSNFQSTFRAVSGSVSTYLKVVSVNDVPIGRNDFRVSMNQTEALFSLHQTTDIIRAVANGTPVVLVLEIGTDFTDNKSGWIKDSKSPTQIPHAVTVVGYNINGSESSKHYLIIRNSWGESWGDHGYAYLALDYCKEKQCAGFAVKDVHVEKISSGHNGLLSKAGARLTK